ncbi:MAG TPA: flagellar basal body-associated FliL family protein [Steroidobacteraceae bacterium]|nr:flagellar basal body-associated FliL family protein [Steroidobacteraceae bacterium]
MATEAAKLETAPKAAAEAPKKKGKLLYIIVALLLVGGAVGGWLAFKPKAASTAAGAAAEKPAPPHSAALYFKFDPAFVVNFGGEGSARYLQVMVEAMTRDPAMLESIKNNEPAVRNDLVLLFSSQDSSTLLSADGKEKLRTATLEAVRKVIAAEGGNPKLVESVYFTSFVIQ